VKQSEPYQLFEEIHNETSKWLSKADVDTDITVLRLLSCIVPSSSASRRKYIESLLRKQFLLNNSFSRFYIGPLFNIIRNLKTSDIQICNAYWSSVLDLLISGKPSIREHHKLLRMCNRLTFLIYIPQLHDQIERGGGVIILTLLLLFLYFISLENLIFVIDT